MLLYMPDSYDQYTHQTKEEMQWEKNERLDYCDQPTAAHDSLKEMLQQIKRLFVKAA